MPLARGVAQRDVWESVRAQGERMGSRSPTGAHRDLFPARERELEALEPAFRAEPGQCGAVLGLGDALCLDAVSRPDAFGEIWPKLRRGYLLDALEHLDRPATQPKRLLGFVDEVADSLVTRGASAGLGSDLRVKGPGVLGSGLELDGETIQLSAYTAPEQCDVGDRRRAVGRLEAHELQIKPLAGRAAHRGLADVTELGLERGDAGLERVRWSSCFRRAAGSPEALGRVPTEELAVALLFLAGRRSSRSTSSRPASVSRV